MYVYIILQVLSMYVYAIYYMYVYKYRCVRACVCVRVCLSVWLSSCLAVCLAVWLSGWLSVCLSVCLPAVCHVCKKQPRDRLLVDFSRFLWFFDMIWYGFDTVVIQLWGWTCFFPSWAQTIEEFAFPHLKQANQVHRRHAPIKNVSTFMEASKTPSKQVWPTSRITTETISKS